MQRRGPRWGLIQTRGQRMIVYHGLWVEIGAHLPTQTCFTLLRCSPPAQLMPPFASGTSEQPQARPACSPQPLPMMGMSMSSTGATGNPSCSAVGMMEPSKSGTYDSSRYLPSWAPKGWGSYWELNPGEEAGPAGCGYEQRHHSFSPAHPSLLPSLSYCDS